MSWNYRVVRTVHADTSISFAIHEVYYAEDGTPDGVTEGPVSDVAETLADLRGDLARMFAACSQPVLEYSDFLRMKPK